MRTLESCLLAYLFNSVWQIAVVFFAAAWISRRARRCDPSVEHRVWVAALLFQVMLPFSCFLPVGGVSVLWRWLPWLRNGPSGANGHITITMQGAQAHTAPDLTSVILACLAVLYLSLTLYFVIRLLWQLRKTHLLAVRARPLTLAGSARQHWEHLCRAFDLSRARIAISSEISGPVTVGVRHKLLLLPNGFLTTLADEDLQAAMAHELAHMARSDFAKNLFYVTLSRAAAYHPLLRRTLAHIAETRELVCDALAADAVAGSQNYAKSLLRLAAALMPVTRPAPVPAIGIFDTNTLERRIMTLQTRSSQSSLPRRFAVGAGILTLGLAAFSSALALRIPGPAPQVEDQENSNPAARVSGGVMAGNLLTRVNPVYPEEARHAGISGAVVLKARIGRDGTIQNLQVVSGPPELTKSAIDAVKQWTYKPYLLNGEPVEVDTTITVNFSLNP